MYLPRNRLVSKRIQKFCQRQCSRETDNAAQRHGQPGYLASGGATGTMSEPLKMHHFSSRSSLALPGSASARRCMSTATGGE